MQHRRRQASNTILSILNGERLRGTPHFLAKKYEELAAEAARAGDMMAAHLYWNHAEHYGKLARGEI